MGEQKALGGVAAEVAQYGGLSLGFDPFGDHGQAETAGQRNRCANDLLGAAVGAETLNESLIQLHTVQRQPKEL